MVLSLLLIENTDFVREKKKLPSPSPKVEVKYVSSQKLVEPA